MSKKFFTCLLFAACFLNTLAQNKKVCITIDDLPAVTNGIPGYNFRLEITKGLLQTFDEYDVPAIGFVNENKLYKKGSLDSMEVDLLEMWLQNGLELGNHTFSHMNYHEVAFEDYAKDVLKGEKVIKALAKDYNSEVRYFRHPYLRVGLRKSHADSLKDFITQHDYIEAPVTIDNADYLFAAAYSKAYQQEDVRLMKRIAQDYLDYMEDKLIFYEKQSIRLYGRHIHQTLLLHANYLNAQHLDELMKIYQDHGYEFVSQTEVLTDPVYSEDITKYGNWGISWIDRWALSRGKKGDFFKDDPKTPEYIKDLVY